ncbi:hypothetical protein AB0K80_03900 [Streptomyces sp. NPDC052682]|uniref:hypothetical protein n=1 Tax=Streptomyces sp. NPDC052682 TaxID=3154954 RepID=UPI00342DE2F5
MDFDLLADLDHRIDASLVQFKSGLRRHDDPLKVVREFITHGSCVAIPGEPHALLREAVAEKLNVHPNRDVYTVGSAKLGFSIKAHARYRRFNDESDVDVAVVSPELYAQLWKEVRNFSASEGIWKDSDLRWYKNNHFKGSIHPKSLPTSPLIPTAADLWELARVLQNDQAAGPYAITFVVWNDMDALESYQASSVALCMESEKL